MPSRHLAGVPAELNDDVAALRAELEIPDGFSAEVEAAAARAATTARTPASDRTDLELVTIDPPGATDLDQAVAIERSGSGFVVWYAIADVAAFVDPGDPIDTEARRRGQTLYAPDRRTPLHPPALSEGAASLLAGQDRPANLWRIALDEAGGITDVSVEKSLVRSREQLTYAQAQQRIDDGTATAGLALLAEVGPLRQHVELERGGISLNLPDQEIETIAGQWRLTFRDMMPVEDWNAQISLLTGISAAELMIDAKVGILRTLPAAEPRAVRSLRQTAKALGLSWPDGMDYPQFVRGLDPHQPDQVAMLNACTTLFRGAGYVAFDGEVPSYTEHAAMATPYAHATAPLRRLGDRWVSEVCTAVSAGTAVPDWVRGSLDELPAIMTASDQRAKKYERCIVDLVEAHRLAPSVGSTFTGVIVDVDDNGRRGRIMIAQPAVEATVRGDDLPLGAEVTARLTTADPSSRKVEFTLT